MKKEVELKFIVEDLRPVKNKLRQLGAKCDWAGIEKNWYFDTPARFIKKRRGMLRLRTTDKTLLTYKDNKIKGRFKTVDEYQVRVSDAEEMKKILGRIGFRVWRMHSKNREYWSLPGADLTLDSLPFGKFVEVEAPKARIIELSKKLGLDFAQSTTKSYIQLLEEYNKTHGK